MLLSTLRTRLNRAPLEPFGQLRFQEPYHVDGDILERRGRADVGDEMAFGIFTVAVLGVGLEGRPVDFGEPLCNVAAEGNAPPDRHLVDPRGRVQVVKIAVCLGVLREVARGQPNTERILATAGRASHGFARCA